MAATITSLEGALALCQHVYQNLSTAELVEASIARNEGMLTADGALTVTTGKFTGRSPKDKYVVTDPTVVDHVDWGPVNQPMSPERFESLYERMLAYMGQRDLFVFDGFGGRDPAYQMAVRVVNEYAWQNLFVRQMLVRPESAEQVPPCPDFTVICMPNFKADPGRDGTNSETFIALNLAQRIILIGGTHYAGEMKKAVFTAFNYLLPFQGVLSMHCSANVGDAGDVALFFGLSGTGKTTLSADPARQLIGDDEHGWSDEGVFNIEGGCYAKCIDLSPEKEPQIYDAIRFGAVLENVMVDPATRLPDYNSDARTENTRAAYPLEHIAGSVPSGRGKHPKTVLFLTADAFGVLPPVAKLTPEQAMYYFVSGYTSKLAGTERGITRPEATFSPCFGGPFLPLPAGRYAELLGERISRHDVNIYLLNTGWSGGAYGTGRRMDLRHTRAMVDAALGGDLEQAEYTVHPIFRTLVPTRCPGVPDAVLQPRQTWADPLAYDRQARELAAAFARNIDKYGGLPHAVRTAGPQG